MVAPENMPRQQNQPPDESSEEEDPKEVIGMGHYSDSGEDLPSGIDLRANLRGSTIREGWGLEGGFQRVGGVVGRGLGRGRGLILRCLLGPVICRRTTIPLMTAMRSLMLM